MESGGFALLGRRVLLSTAALLCSTAAIAGQNKQLNAPFAHPGADIVDFVVDPGETRAVYLADAETDAVVELYSVPLDRSSPAVKLNGPLPAGGDVVSSPRPALRVGANGRVVYRADQLADEVVELFSAPLDGSQPAVRLNPMLVAGGDVRFFELSSDGTRVVYAADQDIDQIVELYVAPSDGSAPAIKLNTPFAPVGIEITGAWISPDGARVVYATRRPVQNMWSNRVWSVPIDASQPPTPLATYFLDDGSLKVHDVEISPNGEWLAYEVVITTSFSLRQFYGVPIDGSAPARMLYPEIGYITSMQFTPDGDWLVFSRIPHVEPGYSEFIPSYHLNAATLAATTGIDEFIVARIGGFQFTENASEVYYASDGEILRVCTDGTTTPTLLATAANKIDRLSWSPDGGRLVFRTGPVFDGPNAIYSLPSAGGEPVLLASASDGPNGFGRIRSFFVSSDARHVVYEERRNASIHELRVVPIDGSLAPRRVNGRLPVGGTVMSNDLSEIEPPRYVVTSDGRVVYGADQEVLGVFELFVTPLEKTTASPSQPVPIPSGHAPGG